MKTPAGGGLRVIYLHFYSVNNLTTTVIFVKHYFQLFLGGLATRLRQHFSNSDRNASRVIPAVRMRFRMMSIPTSLYRGTISGLAVPGFSSLI